MLPHTFQIDAKLTERQVVRAEIDADVTKCHKKLEVTTAQAPLQHDTLPSTVSRENDVSVHAASPMQLLS